MDFHKRLQRYVLSEGELRQNRYPRPDGDGKAKFFCLPPNSSPQGNKRKCSRCDKMYLVNDDGCVLKQETCIYHHNRSKSIRERGRFVFVHECCNQREGSIGCASAKSHVHRQNEKSTTGFKETLPVPTSDPRNTKVYSIDCEKIYTQAGLELARVTMVGEDCQVVYESFIKPDSAIVDYNTRFSGINKNHLEGVSKTLRDVQDDLKQLVSDKTILIGHSLEHDLDALKIIHSTVIDTSIVFLRPNGYKFPLRVLVNDHLKETIQASADGHDSAEDAIACMRLMKKKVR